MSISSRISGPLLASIFIDGGIDAYRNPEGKVKAAEVVTAPLAARIDVLPDDTATLVKMNGAVQVGAGALLALGKFRRLAALTLIGSIIPTTYAGHRFWEEVDDEKKAQQQRHFFKNLGILGGLVMMAMERPAPKSRRQAHKVRRRAHTAGVEARARVGQLAESAAQLSSREAPKVRHLAHTAGVGARAGVGQLAESAAHLSSNLGSKAGDLLHSS